MKQQSKIRLGSAKDILKDVEIPESFNTFLNEEEKVLVKFILGEYNIKELALEYKKRDRAMKTEIVWRLLQLGRKLAMISLFEDGLLPEWTEAIQKENSYLKKAYMNGFNDCKNKVQRIVKDGLRKHTGR